MSKNSSKILYGDHYITSGFGGRTSPITGQYEGHLGVDYGTNNKNIPCYAIEDGIVRIAQWGNGVGNYVFVEYPRLGVVGDYQHLDSISVKVGQTVTKGTQIGIVGTTGDSTGIHLHFGIFPIEDLNKGWYEKRWSDFESFNLKEIVEPTTENKDVDQLKVNSDSTMYVRTEPSLNASKLGLAKSGFYDILEVKEADDYVWCKIADGQWSAVYEPYSSYINKYVEPETPEVPETPAVDPNVQPEPATINILPAEVLKVNKKDSKVKKIAKYTINTLNAVNSCIIGINAIDGITIPYAYQIVQIIVVITGVISFYLLGQKRNSEAK